MKAFLRCPIDQQSPVEIIAKSPNDFVIIQRECDCDIVAYFTKYPAQRRRFRSVIKKLLFAEMYGMKGVWVDDVSPVTHMPVNEALKLLDKMLKIVQDDIEKGDPHNDE